MEEPWGVPETSSSAGWSQTAVRSEGSSVPMWGGGGAGAVKTGDVSCRSGARASPPAKPLLRSNRNIWRSLFELTPRRRRRSWRPAGSSWSSFVVDSQSSFLFHSWTPDQLWLWSRPAEIIAQASSVFRNVVLKHFMKKTRLWVNKRHSRRFKNRILQVSPTSYPISYLLEGSFMLAMLALANAELLESWCVKVFVNILMFLSVFLLRGR